MIRNKAYRPSAPSSSASRAQGSPPKSSRSIPCKYLRPLYAFRPRPSSMEEYFDEDFTDLGSLLQKRFGKKIICVTFPEDMTRANHYSKLFKELQFNKNICQPYSFKCIGDKVVLDTDIRMDALQIKKTVSSALKKITVSDDFDLRILRNTRTVTHLNMRAKGNLNPKLEKAIFRNLRCLETFTFQLTPSSIEIYFRPATFVYADEHVAFFSQLTQLRSLKSVHLNFISYYINSDFLVDLVTVLERLDTCRWYLRARILRSALDYSILLSGILNRIDFLGLEMKDDHFNYDEYEYSPPDLSQSRKIIKHKKRILNLLVKVENAQDKVDLNRLLNRCESLEGVYIKSLGDTLKWVEDEQYVKQEDCKPFRRNAFVYAEKKKNINATEEEKSHQEELEEKEKQVEQSNKKRVGGRKKKLEEEKQNVEWMSRLTDITLNFYMKTELKEKDPFDCLLEVIKKKSRNLKSLNVFYCVYNEEESDGYEGSCGYDRNRYYDSSSSDSESERSDIVYAFPKKLESMESLENLELSTTEISKSLTHMLLSMKNLKKFTLNLCATNDSKPWDENFDFSGLAHVKEFKLVINSDVKAVTWGENLIKKLATLKHLQSIEIIDKTDTEMSLSIFCGFMAALCRLKELRNVVLQTQISKERMYDDKEYLLPEEARACFQEGRNAILEGIKNYVKYMAESMENIEGIDIREVKCYNIGKIYYKKKQNKMNSA